ncbi:MAG: monovalent cation/H+ antiporter subunit D family protein [Candidatus Thermoplasmatota archaeon]|nr:monovalent cation/H+ antiporter subunit D family protein [Candidatus Thermoplasmatota archaeon]
MIPLIVALPMVFAFLLSTISYIDTNIDRIYKEVIFLAGVLSPIPIFLYSLENLPILTVLGGWTRVSGIEIGINGINFFFLLATLIIFPLVALYSLRHFDKFDEKSGDVSKGSKFCLILLLYGGILGSFITRDLFNFTIYTEIVSLAAIILVGSSSTTGAKSASFRYLMVYLLSSFFFIFSVGIIYVKTGYLNFHLIEQNLVMDTEIKVAISVAFTALIMKAGIFPLHFWLPEAHSKADTPISALLSGVTVNVPVFGMILFLRYTSIEFLTVPLMIVAFSSIFFGIFMAIFQTDVKKLLAYSTVSQMGFVLLGISILDIYAAGIYVFAHALVKAALFLNIGILISNQGEKNIEKLSFGNRGLLTITMISLSLGIGGISPFLGGYAKYTILNSLSKWSLYLFYIGSVGTLTLFTRMNYELFEFETSKKFRFSLEELVPFIVALLTIVVGIHYLPKLAIKDGMLVGIAILAFSVLKYSRLLEWNVPRFYGKDPRELGKQINFYTSVFVITNISFLMFILRDILRELF